MKTVMTLQLTNGHVPFDEWINDLPMRDRVAIMRHVHRVAAGGGKKNVKPLGDGIFEIKVNFGPGYRTYFGEDGKSIILLLLGGDKGSQKRDIKQAKMYWRQYAQK